MKEWLIGFVKSAGKKLLILGVIAAAIAAILFLAARPVISESILDTVKLENGVFAMNGLEAGSTREDVTAWLDSRRCTWAEGKKIEHAEGTYYDELFRELDGVDWISLSDTTRVAELGRVTVRRTYYFRDGLLTHADLETDPSKRAPENMLKRMDAVTEALTEAFGPPDLNDGPGRLADEYGEAYVTWEGEGGSGLDVIARRWAVRDHPSDRLKDAAAVPHTDYFALTIRVRAGTPQD